MMAANPRNTLSCIIPAKIKPIPVANANVTPFDIAKKIHITPPINIKRHKSQPTAASVSIIQGLTVAVFLLGRWAFFAGSSLLAASAGSSVLTKGNVLNFCELSLKESKHLW